ncbi:MAG TPA: hypothetical protein VFV41_05640 [Streptosporangiaceae bacterium]|nr:hypothetical protein [Streptosporangiaceae bacterium]
MIEDAGRLGRGSRQDVRGGGLRRHSGYRRTDDDRSGRAERQNGGNNKSSPGAHGSSTAFPQADPVASRPGSAYAAFCSMQTYFPAMSYFMHLIRHFSESSYCIKTAAKTTNERRLEMFITTRAEIEMADALKVPVKLSLRVHECHPESQPRAASPVSELAFENVLVSSIFW